VLVGSNGPTWEQNKEDNIMKRIAWAGVAALALTLACQQKACAWDFGVSVNFGVGCNGHSCCSHDCCFPGCYYFGYGYKWAPAPCHYHTPIVWPCYGSGYGSAAYYGTSYQAAPQYPAVVAQPAYSYPNYAAGYYGGNAYAYNQAPSYWYGR
jgi:hypothetical protein